MDEFLTPEQLATMLNMTPRSVRRYIAEGKLEAQRVGGRWRVSRQAVEAFFPGIAPAATLSEPGDIARRFTDRAHALQAQEECACLDIRIGGKSFALAHSNMPAFIGMVNREGETGRLDFRMNADANDVYIELIGAHALIVRALEQLSGAGGIASADACGRALMDASGAALPALFSRVASLGGRAGTGAPARFELAFDGQRARLTFTGTLDELLRAARATGE